MNDGKIIVGAVALVFAAWLSVRKVTMLELEKRWDGMDDWDEALDVMARTVWGEARGEGSEGMRWVAHVILNRVERGGWWGNTVREVCLKPFQFTCWNLGDPNRDKLQAAADAAFQDAINICARVLKRVDPDPTNGATHYYAIGGVTPFWAPKLAFIDQVGRHRFYREG